VGVEKLSDRTDLAGWCGCCRVLLVLGSGSGHYGLAQEAHQPLDVLRSRCQKELLSNELHASQTQAAQPDLILQFCK